jgi:hypothetical protein
MYFELLAWLIAISKSDLLTLALIAVLMFFLGNFTEPYCPHVSPQLASYTCLRLACFHLTLSMSHALETHEHHEQAKNALLDISPAMHDYTPARLRELWMNHYNAALQKFQQLSATTIGIEYQTRLARLEADSIISGHCANLRSAWGDIPPDVINEGLHSIAVAQSDDTQAMFLHHWKDLVALVRVSDILSAH